MVLAYFGRRWNAPVTDHVHEVPVPVGERCFYCPDTIEDSDRGMIIWWRDATPPVHLECWYRSVMASLEHLKRMDTGQPCGRECNVLTELSPREEGRAMMAWTTSRGGPS